MKNKLIFIFLIINLPLNASTRWIERKAEGWAWYEDLDRTKKIEEREENNKSEKSYSDRLSDVKKTFDEVKARAILEPTEENILIYQIMQKEWTDNASKFTKSWVVNLINHPEIDSRIEYPVTQYGINAIKEVDDKKKKELIKNLSKRYLIFYFYKGSERASQVFSLILKSFADKYKYTFLGILGDDNPIDGFQSLPDNGISSSYGVSVYPSAYFVDIETGEGLPISNGLNSMDQIENNILILFSEKNRRMK